MSLRSLIQAAASLKYSSLLLACWWLIATRPCIAGDAGAHRVDFQRDIRPILSDKCYFCHGPDEKHREAELRLESRQGMFEHTGAKIIVPGKPEASALWKRISHSDPEKAMPPADSGKTLNAKERELIRLWIEQGAEWKDHWAYAAPARPAIPAGPFNSPAVNDIDRLIQARLKTDGQSLSPSANAQTLIRRLSFDLTGLPPSPEDVEAFAIDSTEDALAKLVDRLLASPAFGERWGRHWLDVARYGESTGSSRNLPYPQAWRYRDYVVD
ncbi:MAG: DUF1549 domain-containing protein, partial [Planctomycetes bacterium]|nr:DUF1549 domain-containing protein [Planctomycetota bacterium]